MPRVKLVCPDMPEGYPPTPQAPGGYPPPLPRDVLVCPGGCHDIYRCAPYCINHVYGATHVSGQHEPRATHQPHQGGMRPGCLDIHLISP